MSEYSDRTKYLARLFSDAIKTDPNNAVVTARELSRMSRDRETVEEILAEMSDQNSELAQLLTKIGKAFHKGNDEAPESIEPTDLASMAKQIRTHVRF